MIMSDLSFSHPDTFPEAVGPYQIVVFSADNQTSKGGQVLDEGTYWLALLWQEGDGYGYALDAMEAARLAAEVLGGGKVGFGVILSRDERPINAEGGTFHMD
jgi:hypothetical protein